jgi:hypothetical protein
VVRSLTFCHVVWVVAKLLQSGHYRDSPGAAGSKDKNLHGSCAYARMGVNESACDWMRREAEDFWVFGVAHLIDHILGRHCVCWLWFQSRLEVTWSVDRFEYDVQCSKVIES